MLLCSSKIPVSKCCTPSVFVNLAIDWINKSRNYEFEPFAWDGSSEFIRNGKKNEIFQVGLFENNLICAVHFTSIDSRSIKWTTDYILDIENGILAFQLYRDAPSNIEYINRAFDIPNLIKKLISSGYSSLDNGIEVASKPLLIDDRDVDWIADMMLRKKSYNLPIVYISCDRYVGSMSILM